MSPWIDCKIAIPSHDERVLILTDYGDGHKFMYIASYIRLKNGNDYWRTCRGKVNLKECSHWQPLPEPPKDSAI